MIIGVVGLGYVGLPLALAFGRKFETIAFDIDSKRIDELRNSIDRNREFSPQEIQHASLTRFTADPTEVGAAAIIVIAVPTPVTDNFQPDFSLLLRATETVARILRRGCTVVFESTVYPGATEEHCIPVLESVSGLQWKKDFFVGYSPERINPGDKQRTIERVVKVVAGDCDDTAALLKRAYGEIVQAGIHVAPSIRVAEAAKVIENTQRDLNIALMNELATIFKRMGISSKEVFDAASTKWNFLPFRPGLVGGHCICVDPYYLTYQAQRLGLHPKLILAGRGINNSMGSFIANELITKLFDLKGHAFSGTVNILGATFKENCTDVRNSRTPDIAKSLAKFRQQTHICDPLAEDGAFFMEHGRHLVSFDELPRCDALVVAVAHSEFREMSLRRLLSSLTAGGLVVDVKSILNQEECEELGFSYWAL